MTALRDALFISALLICAVGVIEMNAQPKLDEFSSGFLAGYWGHPLPEDASEEFKKAYGRGYETSERESAIAGEKL